MKCHNEWNIHHGLSTEPERLERADKCFRYLSTARDRADLDARLHIFERKVLPKIFDTVDAQEAYFEYLLCPTWSSRHIYMHASSCTGSKQLNTM